MPVNLIATGDLQLGDSSTTVGFGFRSRYPDVPAMQRWSAHVRAVLGQGDIVFGNLECTLAEQDEDGEDWRSFQMRGRTHYAAAIREAGFTVLNVANNHAMQHGTAAFEETVRAVEQTGIAIVGRRGATPWHSTPARIPLHGGGVGMLGYSLRPRQYSSAEPLYAEGDEAAICADVRRLRSETTHVIVSLHWGEEFVPQPSLREVRLARAIVDAGATVVLGHHPHVTRPLQRVGSAVVAYSLGNFSGDMIWYAPHRTGGVLRCDLENPSTSARMDAVFIGEDCLPRPTGTHAVPADTIDALDEVAYQRAIQETLGAQRVASYAYTFRNVHRFRPRMMAQLVATTIANRLRSLIRVSRDVSR